MNPHKVERDIAARMIGLIFLFGVSMCILYVTSGMIDPAFFFWCNSNIFAMGFG